MALGDCKFIAHVPETKAGHTAIVVFVDRLSKTVHFAPRWNDMGAEEFALRTFALQHTRQQEYYNARQEPHSCAGIHYVIMVLMVC